MALLPPGVPHARNTGDELEDAVGGGEHAARETAREREERVDHRFLTKSQPRTGHKRANRTRHTSSSSTRPLAEHRHTKAHTHQTRDLTLTHTSRSGNDVNQQTTPHDRTIFSYLEGNCTGLYSSTTPACPPVDALISLINRSAGGEQLVLKVYTLYATLDSTSTCDVPLRLYPLPRYGLRYSNLSSSQFSLKLYGV
jgi:hypothetical protein